MQMRKKGKIKSLLMAWCLACVVTVLAAGCGDKDQDKDPPSSQGGKDQPSSQDATSGAELTDAAQTPSADIEHYENNEHWNDGGSRGSLHRAVVASAPSHHFRELIQRGADVGAPSSKGVSPLHYAAGYSNVEATRTLIQNGADLNARDDEGYSPLHWLCLPVGGPELQGENHREIAEQIIAQGADINGRSNDRRTPLHVAAKWNCIAVAEVLVAHGADLRLLDGNRMTPFQIAKGKGHDQLAEIIRPD